MAVEDDEARRDRVARRRRRRGDARRFVPDNSVPSPCIAVCQIDNATNCCIGCFRSIDEIREWPIMTAEQKTQALSRVAERKAEAAASRPRPEAEHVD